MSSFRFKRMNTRLRFLGTLGRPAMWLAVFALTAFSAVGESWQEALARMPLTSHPPEITRTNFAELMLTSFASNQTVKALVLMPGATDEYYFFHRGRTKLTGDDTSLLDAVKALTNQTRIRATFRAPLLLLHTAEDPLEPRSVVRNQKMAVQIKEHHFIPHAEFNDRDWDYLLPILTESLDADFSPTENSRDSWHFYRHSLAGWNLTAWEALEAISLAGKTTFSVEKLYLLQKRPHLTFKPDHRFQGSQTGK